MGSVADFASRGRVPRAAHLGLGRRPELSRDCQRHANQCRHHRALENTLRAGSVGWTGRTASGRKPRTATPAVQARVARRVQQKPRDGSTHWSCRRLARELGVSKSTVQRILTQARLKPHRLQRYLASDDPDFEAKAADIIGLYLHPPQHAAVFCVDEKTAIQALDRLDPVLPLSPGRAERHGFEYYRTAPCRSMPLWMCRPARWPARPRNGTPARSSLPF